MASKLSAPFTRAASAPLLAAARKLAAGQLSEGLLSLSRKHIEDAYEAGIEATMRALHVRRDVVERALGADDAQQVLDDVQRCQLAAKRSVGQFVGTLGTLLPDSAEHDEPASRRLRAVADKYALDKHIAQPIGDLSQAIATWEDLLTQASERLASDGALHRAMKKRRLVRAAITLTFLSAMGGSAALGTWHHVVIAGARERIATILEDADPCRAETVDNGDLAHALPGQVRALAKLQTKCEEKRAREAYLQRCAQLAKHVEEGKLSDEDTAVAKSALGLLKRLTQHALTPKDLTIGPDAMPCQDTPSHDRLWKAYGKSVTTSAALWGKVETLSPHVRSLLTAKGTSLSDRARQTLLFRVEADTKRAITSGLKPKLDHARRLCLLVDGLGYPKEPWCKALDRLSSAP